MGASESTGRLNQTETEEEEERRGQRESGGGSSRAGAIAIATAGAAVAAWGISRMGTGRNETETEDERRRRGKSGGSSSRAGAIAIATAGAAVAGWGISRMRSDSKEKDEARMITTHDQGANRNTNSDVHQTQTKYFGSGSTPLLDLYKPTLEDIELTEKGIWFPPPSNRVKMNTDGAFHPAKQGQPSAYAGILRNHDCKCIVVFRGWRTGPTEILEVEIFGILKGLELLAELGHKGAILENDNDEAVLWINGEDTSHTIPKERMAHCKEMIHKCRTLAKENIIAVRNIDREANKCADKLASLAFEEPTQQVQANLPDTVRTFIDKDKAAYYNP